MYDDEGTQRRAAALKDVDRFKEVLPTGVQDNMLDVGQQAVAVRNALHHCRGRT